MDSSACRWVPDEPGDPEDRPQHSIGQLDEDVGPDPAGVRDRLPYTRRVRRTIAIVGSTATGKSSLAMALAHDFEGEILNADALQVYRGFDIGTAKPSVEERAQVPHHLIDCREPSEPFSAGQFARLARACLDDIHQRGRLPIVVGGSGLYVRALFEGIHEIPAVDPSVREALNRRLETEGLDALRTELARLDPATERRLAPNDRQRILRALEVALGTGRPLARWIAAESTEKKELEVMKLGLTMARPLLYDRIEQRVETMLEEGWLEEIESLLRGGLSGHEAAFQAIGYRQLADHVRGESSREEAVEAIVRATRRYAKRQETWFRRDAEIVWLEAAPNPDLLEQARQLCGNYLNC